MISKLKKIIMALLKFATTNSTVVNPNPTPNPTVYLQPSNGLGFGTVSPLNWQDFFENTYIPAITGNQTRSSQTVSPSVGGAYRSQPLNGKIDWYFSNMAMNQYVGTPNYVYNGDLGAKSINVQTRIKEYMNKYIGFLNTSTNTINNRANITASGSTADTEDSHDSYISTFLQMASNYMATYNDTTWWNSNLGTLKNMANTLIANIDPTYSMTANLFFQPILAGGFQPQFYLEDNTESYRGLKDFSLILRQLNDASWSFYDGKADVIKNGIENNLYNSSQNRFEIAIEKAPTLGYVFVFNPTRWYADWQCQTFPTLYDVPITASKINSAYNTMNTSTVGSQWNVNTVSQWSSATNDSFAFQDGFLALVGAKKGLVQQSKNVIQRTEEARNNFGYVTISDIAFAGKAKKLLNI